MRLSTESVYETVDFDKPTRAKLADEWVANAKLMQAGAKGNKQSNLLTLWIDERMRTDLAPLRAAARRLVYDKDNSVEKEVWDLIAFPSGPSVVTVRTEKVLRGPIAITPYGGQKGWRENFAEAFAFYVMGRDLPAEIAAIMSAL